MATINALASRLTGVAPLAVFFETVGIAGVTEPPLVSGHREYADFGYTWGFDDPTSDTWGTSGKSKDVDDGYVAAHIFETAGTYTVTVDITDGAAVNESHEVVITVTDPDTVYSGTNTICMSSTGDFTGCPSGATQDTTTTFADITTHIAAGRRVLLRRGDSWTSGASIGLGNVGPLTIGAYGAGTNPDERGIFDNNPVINATGTTETGPFSFTNQADCRIMDITMSAPITRPEGISGKTGLDRILINRVKITGFDDCANYGHFDTGGHDQLAVVNCDFFEGDRYALYMGSERLMIMGNRLRDTGTSHVCRVWQSYKGVIKHNEMSGSSIDNSTGLQALKFHGPNEAQIAGSGPTDLDNRSEFTILTDNLFGQSGPWPVGIGPNASDADERLSNIVFENNRCYAGYGTLSTPLPRIAVRIWASFVTARNNIIAGEGSQNSFTGVTVSQRGIEPYPDRCRVYNNTIYKMEDPVGEEEYTGIVVGAGCTDTVVRNNIAQFNASVGTRLVLDDSGTATVQSNNTLTDDAGLVDPENATYLSKDFSLTSDSIAVDAGTDVPVFKDFNGNARQAGDAIDLGAYEYIAIVESTNQHFPKLSEKLNITLSGNMSGNLIGG